MLKAILTIETDAATVDEAVTQALTAFGCSRADVETTILPAPARRLFGLFRGRPARVHLRLTDRAYIAPRRLKHLLRLSALPARVEAHPGARAIELRIHSEIPGAIISRRGQTLEALLSLMVMLADRVSTDPTPILLVANGNRSLCTGCPVQPLHSPGGRDYTLDGPVGPASGLAPKDSGPKPSTPLLPGSGRPRRSADGVRPVNGSCSV